MAENQEQKKCCGDDGLGLCKDCGLFDENSKFQLYKGYTLDPDDFNCDGYTGEYKPNPTRHWSE